MPENIIQTRNLNFSFSGKRKTLDSLSLNVPKGSIYGFLGPNGAGKSTTMRLLSGIIPDDSNSIELFGQPLNNQLPHVFNKVGCLVESPALYPHLTGYENLKYVAIIHHVSDKRIEEILQIVDLKQARNMKVKKYSLGMKQRIAIGMALMHDPDLLLLDEPVNGLDPAGIIDIRKLLIRLNHESGKTVFISSHLLSEIEKLCTHTGIISKGQLKYEGTMKELSGRFGVCRVSIYLRNAEIIFPEINNDFAPRFLKEELRIEVSLPDKESIPGFVDWLHSRNAEIYEVRILGGIEDWFMSFTE